MPLKNDVSKTEVKNLSMRLLIWSVCAVAIYNLIFGSFGISAASFKAILMIGWLPFFLISVATIRRSFLQHIFIFGMAELWVMLQHNWISILDVIFFSAAPLQELFLFHSAAYVAISIMALTLVRKFFNNEIVKIFAPFFDERPQGLYIALLPIFIGAGHFLLWADAELIHSWAERFSRIYLLFALFFIYRHSLTVAQNFSENQKTLHKKNFFEKQLNSLTEYNNYIQENQRRIDNLRENLHFGYDNLIKLLKNSDVNGALQFLNSQENLLESTKIIRFCRAALINAAISIYRRQAEKFGIDFKYKIEMPKKFRTDESDFAVLISNLLENAINASKTQPPAARAVSIIIKFNRGQCILEVANKYSAPLKLNKDGFPVTSKARHGIGMQSIKIFAQKYNAQANFQQENGAVKFLMYWED